MTDEPLEPRLTPEDLRVLRCLPECVQPGRLLDIEQDGLRFILDPWEKAQIIGLAHLGYANLWDSGRCGRTHKGDEYIEALDAPAVPAEQERLA